MHGRPWYEVVAESVTGGGGGAGFHTGFFAGGGKLFQKSKCPCRGAWGYSIRGSLSLDMSC